MSDTKTTIQSLKTAIAKFRDARDWGQHNDHKSLAEALVFEAAELLEVFLWKDKALIEQELKKNESYRTALSDEMADVFVYLLQLASDTGIDISEAVEDKMRKNELKYPVKKWKGKATNKYVKT